MPLDQGQGLQDRVVHAGRDLRALLAADPGRPLSVALEREPPQPWPGDQEQRARDRARGKQGGAGTPALEEEHRAAGGDRKAGPGERGIRAEASAPAPGERETAGDQGDCRNRAV